MFSFIFPKSVVLVLISSRPNIIYLYIIYINIYISKAILWYTLFTSAPMMMLVSEMTVVATGCRFIKIFGYC